MPRITITIEGEAEEIRGALQNLLGATSIADTHNQASGTETNNNQASGTDKESMQIPFTPNEIRQVWEELGENARLILEEIAKHPNNYPFEDLRKNLGLRGPTVSGQLSSLGFALRRLNLQQGKPQLLIRDWKRNTYKMTPEVAETILKLARNEEDLPKAA